MPSLNDYATANSIEHFIQYYTFFSTVALLLNAIRFFFYIFIKSDSSQDEIKDLKEQVENLNNILEEVIKHVTRDQTNYDEEKAEFVEEVDEKQPPATSKCASANILSVSTGAYMFMVAPNSISFAGVLSFTTFFVTGTATV